MAEEIFGADTDALRRGGANIQDVAELAGSIFGDLNAACTRYAQAGGDGEIGRKWAQNYKPGERGGLRFLQQVTGVLQDGGTRIVDVAGVYDTTNTDANTNANSGGRR